MQLTRRLDNSRGQPPFRSNPALGPFLRLFARLPLPLVHFLGGAVGLLGLLRVRHRRMIADNLRQAGLYSPGLLLRVARELGKGVLELVPIWLRPLDQATGLVRAIEGWEHLEAARAQGKGVIVLGPHLGCLELAGLFIAARMPITALYRRPRQDWVHAMMQAGRNRGQARMVEPGLSGVRALLRALKANEAAWVLPDQATNKGEGQWAQFFGRWAYMPTLLYRLRAATGAATLMFACERLPWGRGYRLWIEPLPDLPQDAAAAATRVNGRVEALVRRFPSQYLWSYRFYRRMQPDVAPPPEGDAP